MKNPKWIVVEGSFDFSNYMIGMVVGLNPVRPISEGWLTPQLNHPGVKPTKNWQEFFMEKVMENIDDNGKIDLPLYSWISDKSDLTMTDKEREKYKKKLLCPCSYNAAPQPGAALFMLKKSKKQLIFCSVFCFFQSE